MRPTTDTVERAYQLARSGSCSGIVDVTAALQREGYTAVASHLVSPSLRKELTALCRKHWVAPPADDQPD